MAIISGGGGGSSPVQTRAVYTHLNFAFPPATLTQPPWTFQSGTALLDLTDPTNPIAVAAGVYAVTVVLQGATLAAGKSLDGQLFLDLNGDAAFAQGNTTLDPAQIPAGFNAWLPLTVPYYVPAGGVIAVYAQHNMAADPGNFSVYQYVQRFS